MKLSTITSPTPTYPIIIAGTNEDTLKEQGDPDYSTFQEVPDDYTKVAYRTSSTDVGASAKGATLTTTYQAYINQTQPAGTYTGQVKYTLVHPNDGAAPEKPISIENAMQLAGKQKLNGYYKMQDMTTSICEATNTYEADSRTQLIDTRDNQTYYVAKLLDGKCWMTENLNITGGTELSSDDTDFDSNYTLPTTDGWAVSNDKLILPASSTAFNTSNYAYVYNSGNKENCGASEQTNPCYSYYSWDAATVGSGRNMTGDNIDAPYSICPKGWKLPINRGGGSFDPVLAAESDYYHLAVAYGANLENNWSGNSATFYNNAGPGTTANFILAGFYAIYGTPTGGSTGYYHSATRTKYMFFTSSLISFTPNNEYFGASLRCLAK